MWLLDQTELKTKTVEKQLPGLLQLPLFWVWLIRLTTNKNRRGHVNIVFCTCYLGDVDVVGVMLGGRDHERDAFIQLDACQRGDPHVEEDAKEHCQRDEAEHVCHHHGHA